MTTGTPNNSEFHAVYDNPKHAADFYEFLKNIFHLYPEDKFHALIQDANASLGTDEEIYNAILAGLPKIKTLLAPITYALPALKKQKQEMTRETMQLLGARKEINGIVEIGSTGRYVSELRKHIKINDPVFLTNDIAPTNSPADIMERGQIAKLGTFFLLDYKPLDSHGIAPASVDLITSFIGLHHCPPDLLDEFVRSIQRVIRPGGLFIIRDHNAVAPEMATFCSLVHTVFNAGLGVPWPINAAEIKHFRSADAWAQYIIQHNFTDAGQRLLQPNDPTDNTLMAFIKS